MNTANQVTAIRDQMLAEGAAKPDIIRQIALACIGWPYVFGAWGEECSPSNRKRRVRDSHPTIKSKCQVLSGRRSDCNGCQWYPQDERVRMFDCRGFTDWLLKQVGIDLYGDGATTQYNTDRNWVRRGPVSEMPDNIVCCVFRKKDKKMEHTGMCVGGGVTVDCSVNVRSGGMSGWTHYAVPKGLYREEDLPVVKPTLRKSDSGDAVVELQTRLNELNYDCGTVDGKFGNKTLVAVKEFQRDHGLDTDGVVGRKTWAALDEGSPVPKYTVRCYGMRWDEVQRIREICPSAEVQEE